MENKEDNTEPEENKKEPVKVTLADADKDDQKVFKDAIKDSGIKTDLTVANTGEELLTNLKDEHIPNPDVIFLDIDMPRKGGLNYLDEIKKDENLKDIPTVIYTTSEKEKDIDETLKHGADLYVPKPVFFRNLVLLFRKVVQMMWRGLLLKPFRKDYVLREEDLSKKQEGKK